MPLGFLAACFFKALTIPSSSFDMPDLVFGTGGRFGRLSITLSTRLVSYAIDHGIRYFDTGFEYCSRRSQVLLFDILDNNKYLLDSSVYVSTKFPVPQKSGELTALVNSSLSKLSCRDYLDAIFLWGPSLYDLDYDFIFDELAVLKKTGKIRSWGINTHCSKVMSGIIDRTYKLRLDHIMLDYNLLQQDREPFISAFFDQGICVWAGTVLCQGFLSQSLVELFLRTRSISYLARAFLQPSTRRFLVPGRIMRANLKTLDPEYAKNVPLAFVAANPYVSKISIGMLSSSSIQTNLHVIRNPPKSSLLYRASKLALSHSLF